MENKILFYITKEQAEKICKYCHKDINKLNEYEISDLLDKIINNLDIENHISRID